MRCWAVILWLLCAGPAGANFPVAPGREALASHVESARLGNVTALLDARQAVVGRYAYDPFGNLLGLKLAYDLGDPGGGTALSAKGAVGWNHLAELNGTNNALVRSYTWGQNLSGSLDGASGSGGLLMVTDHSDGTTHFPCYDGNGNVALLSDGTTGVILAQYEYGPFGEVIRQTGPMAKYNPSRFSTKYQDDETDLLYYGYRYFSLGAGRWPNRDPIGEKGGVNLYALVKNSPGNRVDPLGRKLFEGIRQTTWAEKVWYCRHKDCGDAANEVTDLVRSFMRAEFGWRANDDGTQENALLHCTWMCSVASLPQCGSQAAGELGEAHEKRKNNPWQDKTMDLHNNDVGINAAEPGNTVSDCFNACKAMLPSNKLIWYKQTAGDPASTVNWPL